MKLFQVTGAAVLNTIERLGRAALFLYEILGNSWTLARRFYLVIQQVYAVGVFTLPIVLVSGLFVGMVLGLQAITRWSSSARRNRWVCWWRYRCYANSGRW